MTYEEAKQQNRLFKDGDRVNIEKIPNGFSCEFMLRETGCQSLQELSSKVFIVEECDVIPLNDGNYLEEIYLDGGAGGIFNNYEIKHIK